MFCIRPKKLSSIIRTGKDMLPLNMRTNVIYKIDCMDCNACYVGQTKRHFKTRIKEHKNDIKKKHESALSVVNKHRLDHNHDFDWLNPSILHTEQHYKKREVAEMIFIRKHGDTINLQKDTENLNSILNII